MSEMAVSAPPTSWARIDQMAWSIRCDFELHERPFLPVIGFAETILSDGLEAFELRVWSDADCEGAEGFTCPHGSHITLPESVYRGACANNPRDRFTVAHELGHFFLHAGRPLARLASGLRVQAFRDPEAQANRFAAAILMPWGFFEAGMTAFEVMDKFGVSRQAAVHRLAEWEENSFRLAHPA